MIDLHCHILPKIDDGSRSMDETIAILKEAVKAGFHTICFTPHYAEPQYSNTKNENEKILEEVRKIANLENLKIELLLGNEIFISADIEKLLKIQKVAPLAGSQYVLIEVPMYQELPQEIVHNMLDCIKQNGYKIIIAHPERYIYIQQNPNKLLEYFGNDVVFQGNYGSILGSYGKDAQKTIKKLLKNKNIHYFSTDVHRINRCFYIEFDKIKKKLLKLVDNEYYEILTEKNPKLVIENKEIIKEIANENINGN